MRRITLLAAFSATMMVLTNAQAATLFIANLNGAQDSVATPATGFGTVLLNDAQNMITVDMSWVGLIGGPATVAHIHCCAPPGSNAAVLFPFVIPNVVSGSMAEQNFAITAAQVAQLQAGNMYMNIHNAQFPGGEIRGQLAASVPEPASVGLMGMGFAVLMILARRRWSATPRAH